MDNTIEQNSTLDYYDVGTGENPVISNSSLTTLNPEQGGSITKFMNFFREKEEGEEKNKLVEGKLLHRYIEAPDQFVVSEVEKPGGMLGDLCNALFINVDTVKALPSAFTGVDIQITSNLKSEKGRDAEILGTRDSYQSLANLLQVKQDDLVACFRKARFSGNFYSSYTDEGKLINKIINEGLDYLKELSSTKGKIILDKKTKGSVEGAINSLYTNQKICSLLQLDNHIQLEGIGSKMYSETPVYWQEKVSILGNDAVDLRLNAKAKIDKFSINLKEKRINLIELKTTAYPFSLFFNSFKDYHYYRQLAFYIKALMQWLKTMYPDVNFQEFNVCFYIVVVETKGFHESGIYEVGNPWIFKGRNEYTTLLKRYAWHKHTGEFTKSYEEGTSETGYLSFPNPEN